MTEEKLDRVLETITELRIGLATLIADVRVSQDKHADVEGRLRSLERARWMLMGAAVVAGGVSGKIAAALLGG